MYKRSDALIVKVLASDSRLPGLGTRLTYSPRDLLVNCSFDADEHTPGEESRPPYPGS
jgi:hypothetical protein